MNMPGPSRYSYQMPSVDAIVAPLFQTLPPNHTKYMYWIEDLTNSDLNILFWIMPQLVRVILNYGVGGYYVDVSVRAY